MGGADSPDRAGWPPVSLQPAATRITIATTQLMVFARGLDQIRPGITSRRCSRPTRSGSSRRASAKARCSLDLLHGHLSQSPMARPRPLLPPLERFPVRTKHVIHRRITTLRHLSRPQPVDISLKHRPIVINEQITTAIIAIAKGPHQERCHLTPRSLNTYPDKNMFIHRRITTTRHLSRPQPVDVPLKHRPVVINEQVTATVVGGRPLPVPKTLPSAPASHTHPDKTCSFTGGLQPLVISSAANQLISSSNTFPAMSTKSGTGHGVGKRIQTIATDPCGNQVEHGRFGQMGDGGSWSLPGHW